MKYMMLAIIWLTVVSLVACATPVSAPSQIIDKSMATASLMVPTATTPAETITPVQTTTATSNEEVEIRDLVENFGKKLQNVSLQTADAAQQLQKEYSDFVSPALLETWMSDVSKAPGRMVSSPWPDRIEITTLSKEGSDRYDVTGFVIDVTSTEVNSGGAAAKIPVHIVLQKEQGRWLITEYNEQR